ncbi:zinc-ribbon domain-containing protein [Candidatus Pelagibacter sp.]|nr:zinc-ribbon domain-containing protein [Candidatus Pelagibacter sp.]
MIITCPSCKKQFELDSTLIPDDGRDLQCGSCNHIWFYEIEKKITEPLTLKENIPDQKTIFSEQNESIINIDIKKDKIKEKTTKIKKKENNLINKLFSYLIVIIISIVAMIILVDTFKKPLIEVFPGLELILFNLFETLKDIKLFIIDLS